MVGLSLSEAEMGKVRCLLHSLIGTSVTGQLPEQAVTAMVELIPCEDISRLVINPRTASIIDRAVHRVVYSVNPGDDTELDELFWAAYRSESVCSYPYRTQSVDGVFSATDFMSQRQLAKSLTGALFRMQEVWSNAVVPLWLDSAGEHRLEFFRCEHSEFSERDKLVLNLLRPHLAMYLKRVEADAASRHPSLTDRQSELMALVASGLANRQIASRLCLSEGTVRRHLDNIFTRLGVNSRTAAVAAVAQEASTSCQHDARGIALSSRGAGSSLASSPAKRSAAAPSPR